MLASKVSPRRSFFPVSFLSILALATTIAAGGPPGDSPVATPTAVLETEPVPSKSDAADDPAIWVHPTKPEQSLVLGTDKKGGLNVFDLDGRRTQVVSDGSRPNNVDVIYGFPMSDKVVDLAVAGTRSKAHPGVAFWRIDPETRRLTELGPIPSFKVFGGGEPYGSCVYKSPRDRASYLFLTSKDGNVEQYRLESDGQETIRGKKVRSLKVGSTTEGCVADFHLACVYVAEEKSASGSLAPSQIPDRRARWLRASEITG